MRNVVIVAAARTAVGSFSGALASIPAVELGRTVIEAVIERSGIAKADIDEVILGQVLQGGCGQNPTRQAAIFAGLPESVPSYTVNKLCGSGLKTVALAALSIAAGEADAIIAGGMESMSQAPYILEQARGGYRLGNGTLVDAVIKDGLTDAFNDIHMGITAENIAARYNITREEADVFALESQQKAAKAISYEFNKPISVINSRNLSGGLGLLVLRAAEAIELGFKHDQVVRMAQDWTNNIKIFVSVQDLKYMIRGGRLSAAKGLIARLLNINPIVSVDETGKVIDAKPGARGSTTTSAKLFAKARGAARATDPRRRLNHLGHTCFFVEVVHA